MENQPNTNNSEEAVNVQNQEVQEQSIDETSAVTLSEEDLEGDESGLVDPNPTPIDNKKVSSNVVSTDIEEEPIDTEIPQAELPNNIEPQQDSGNMRQLLDDAGFATYSSLDTPIQPPSSYLSQDLGINNPFLAKQKKIESINLKRTIEDIRNNSFGYVSPFLRNKQISDRISQDFAEPFKDRRLKLTEYDVDIDESHVKLSDGTYIPKYKEGFFKGLNSEEILAQQQSTWQQISRGTSKFVGKTLLNIVDGTAGFVYGIANGLKEGSMQAVWDNDFSNLVDDLNKRMDHGFSNYYTEEQKKAGFLRSMATVNFWFNDVAGGAAYLLGALGSELVWTTLTFGAAAPILAGRAAFRLGAKSLIKQGGKAAVRGLYKNPLKMMKAYNRAISVTKAGKAFNTLRYMATSAGFEATTEAKGSFNEALDDYIHSYKSVHGKLPSNTEMATFIDAAASSTNWVFLANMAILGVSNLAQFGSYFGLGGNFSSRLSKALGRKFGLGVKRVGLGTYEGLSKGGLKKLLAKSYFILEKPLTEGAEEASQGIFSETSKNWLAARYNPDALDSTYGLMDAASEGIKHTFGTNEGFKEVGIGMLLGGLGSIGSRGKDGSRTPFGIGEYSSSVNYYSAKAKELTKASERMTEAQKRTLDRLVAHNQFATYLEKAQKAHEKGDLTQGSIDWDIAQYSKMQVEHDLDMLDEGAKDFEHVVENMDSKELMENYGLEESQVEQYKQALLEEYKQNLGKFKKATAVAEALSPNAGKLKVDKKDYTKELALNIYLGMNAGERAKDLANTISEVLGDNGAASILEFYSDLDSDKIKTVQEIQSLNSKLEALRAKYRKLRGSFTSSNLDVEVREVDNQNNAKELTETEKQVASLSNEIQKLESKKNVLLTDLASKKAAEGAKFDKAFNPFTEENTFTEDDSTEFVSESALEEQIKSLGKLNEYLKALEKKDKAKAAAVNSLLQEYIKQSDAFREFSIIFESMADPKFGKNTDSLLGRALSNIGEETRGEFSKTFPTEESHTSKELEAYIEKNKDRLSESDIHTLRTLVRMSVNYHTNIDIGVNEKAEVVSDEVFKEFQENKEVPEPLKDLILAKVSLGKSLSSREQVIYDTKKDEWQKEEEKTKKQRGDEPLESVVVPQKTFNGNTLLDKLKNLVESIRAKKGYLSDFDIENISEEDKPTDAEYKRFEELSNAKHSDGSALTPSAEQEYQALKLKINNWGRLEGTLAGSETEGEFQLAEIMEQIFALEKDLGDKTPISPRLQELSDLIDSKTLRVADRNSNYDYLQTFGSTMASKTAEGNRTVLSNLTLNGFLNLINKSQAITVQRKGQNLQRGKGGWNLNDVEVGQSYTILFDVNGKTEKMTVKITEGHAIEFSEASNKKINTYTSLSILPNSTTVSKYSPVLIEVEENGKTKLIPLPSDVSYDDGTVLDIEAVLELRTGDTLSLEVSTEVSYNKSRLEAYKNAKEKDKAAVLENITQELLIYVKDSKGRVVGVLKSTARQPIDINNKNYLALKEVRRAAMETVLDNNTLENQRIDLGMEMPVNYVHVGHPNLEFVKEGDSVKVEQLEFTDKALENVKDAGYMLDGKATLRNETKGVEFFPFMSTVMNHSKYKGKRVPFVVIDYKGRKVAYPVDLKEGGASFAEKLDDIVESSLSPNEFVVRANILIRQSGLDVNKLGFTFEKIDQSHYDLVKDALDKVEISPEIDEWLDHSKSLDELLKRDATINIKLDKSPFHSPKIRGKITQVKPKNPKGVGAKAQTTNISKEAKIEAKEETESSCR